MTPFAITMKIAFTAVVDEITALQGPMPAEPHGEAEQTAERFQS
jgi:hypothetical protein